MSWEETLYMEQTKTISEISRRSFMGAAVAATGITAASAQQRSYEQNAPPVRYPDSDIIALDKKFEKCVEGSASIQRLYAGMGFAEGSAWSAGGRYLVWNDIPGNVKF